MRDSFSKRCRPLCRRKVSSRPQLGILLLRAARKRFLVHLDRTAAILALVLLGKTGPDDGIAHQLDVIVRELANFGVVHTEYLCFFGGPESEARDQVHDEEDETGATKAVGEAGDGVGELVGELHPVVVEPAAGDFGETVEVGDVIAIGMSAMISQLHHTSIRLTLQRVR